jgi:hypothetical protein
MTSKKPWDYGKLTLTPCRHYLANGEKPFFWLGDTAWSIFTRLSKEDACIYLKNRSEKGYTIIQCALINLPFVYGEKSPKPVVGQRGILDALTPENDDYWDHVDYIFDAAGQLGLYLAALPVWGALVRDGHLNLDNAESYAEFLCQRYGKRPNLIWVLGGDIRGDANYQLWDTLGGLLKQKNPDKLIAYHPFGRTSSSYWFADRPWLDINMFQSGHRRYDQKNLYEWDEAAAKEPWHGEDNWRYVEHDRTLMPVRPVLDAEPSYEQIPQGLHNAGEPRWQDYHIRRYAWWSVLAGACGHTYGHNAVFQFWDGTSVPGLAVGETWKEAIHHPGGTQMKVLKDLMESINWQNGRPSNAVMDKGQKEGYITAFESGDGIVVYDYLGRSFMMLDNDFGEADAYWINPENGIRSYIGKIPLNEGHCFNPPKKPSGFNDWVLLLKKAL